MMKKSLIFILLSICMVGSVQAQKNLADSLASIFLRYTDLEKQFKEVNSSVGNINKQVVELPNQISGMRKDIEDNTVRLLSMQSEGDLGLQRRHERNVESIRQTVAFVELLEKSLRGLESSTALVSYSTAISQLNNPTNDELGFKLSDVMTDLVENKIFKGRRNRQRPRFLSVLTNMVNNPITRGVAGMIPGVSAAVTSISGVSNLVSNLVANNNDIDTNDNEFKEFQEDLGRYLVHYESLNKAGSDLQINLNNLKLKIEALRTVTNEFIKEQVIELYADDNKNIAKDLEGLKIDKIISTYYNRDNVQDILAKTERIYRTQRNEINYKLIKDKGLLQYSLLSRNKVQFVAEEFDKLANEYTLIMSSYHRGIIKILDDTQRNNIKAKKEKVEEKKTVLNDLFKDSSVKYENLVDLSRIKDLLKRLPKL